ncbi:alpha/beta hydrolase [Polaribacter sp. Z014]|uniref:alpha/beta fold hydrolase n=1 Tax=unclassified Polaribacter TaxID=196858 RepID=UPI00193B019E|nr:MULTISPECIES: alpha/beta hydrolase [unclassified Polaribacter]MCL7762217.1 alpha/beta hydrolase [Polaribacter sp. Z014]QVY64358.1 alpha/beta hydrolase [Polaribacter sp. Q13]
MILDYKNANIFYTDQGKGTAVVLIHGFLENSTMWDKIVPELTKRNRVITIDLLGHGKSDCLGYVHSMGLFAETVEAVLKHLKIRKYILVGHSLGGYISLAFAKINPSKIKGLCLLNSTSNEDSEERKKIRIRANKMVQNNFESMVKMSISNLFNQENLLKFNKEIEAVKKEALQTSLQGYVAANEGMKNRENLNQFLKESNFRKLIIVGEKDLVLDLDSSKKEANKTNSELIVFPDGHMSHIENKIALISTLKKFIKSC